MTISELRHMADEASERESIPMHPGYVSTVNRMIEQVLRAPEPEQRGVMSGLLDSWAGWYHDDEAAGLVYGAPVSEYRDDEQYRAVGEGLTDVEFAEVIKHGHAWSGRP